MINKQEIFYQFLQAIYSQQVSDFEKDTDDWVMEEANWERFRIELRKNHSVIRNYKG